jgi:hypothetical protein
MSADVGSASLSEGRSIDRRLRKLPIFAALRARFFVDVPLGSLIHFQLPTRLYSAPSAAGSALARSSTTRIWVSTRDLVPPLGMPGMSKGRLDDR